MTMRILNWNCYEYDGLINNGFQQIQKSPIQVLLISKNHKSLCTEQFLNYFLQFSFLSFHFKLNYLFKFFCSCSEFFYTANMIETAIKMKKISFKLKKQLYSEYFVLFEEKKVFSSFPHSIKS